MASLAAGRALDGRAPSPARPADSWDGGVHEGTHPFPLARRRGGRLKPPVYDPGRKSRFAVRINTMPRGQIIAQRQETHLRREVSDRNPKRRANSSASARPSVIVAVDEMHTLAVTGILKQHGPLEVEARVAQSHRPLTAPGRIRCALTSPLPG
jgi:hypothetical protein